MAPSPFNHSYTPDRDFVSYGLDQPTELWPNGAKIAVSFVLNYEEGAEHTSWNGDDRSCEFLHELNCERKSVVGDRDLLVESMFEYGIRQGLPRIMKLFKRFGWRFTMWVCARAFETSGNYPKLLVEHGHEVACHGNRWRIHGESFEEELYHINRSFDRLQAATGLTNVPTGWFLGNGPVDQKLARATVHKNRGVPLVYCSDTYATDIPYWVQDPLVVQGDEDKGMLMIPYSLATNDHLFMVAGGNGVGCPNDWFELLKSDFDTLYAEGQSGTPKMMTVAMHNRMVGKPGRSMALQRFMEYISTKPDVWVCTRAEIAQHWREKYPYEKVGVTAALHGNPKIY